MATALEPLHADDVEAVLIRLDADYRTIYGPDLGSWSKGVRGEFFDLSRSRRTMDHEAHPLHPRRASAARRRRHRTQLAYRIHRIAPGAVTVLLTPVWSDVHGPMERVFVVTARNADGQHLKLPRGGSRQITALVQGAFPTADWDRTHTWRADTNQLTGWQARRYAA
ncbi:hypothetical protein ABT186_01630 [Streptomyces sp. NPDC001634]|uniref:hypothetical protein n=1 Tax=Streptomyces sp. NPDC001634 TaxID=3154390 RepID=UPI0033211993